MEAAHTCSGGGATVGAVAGSGGKLRCPAPISRLRVEKIEGGLMVAGVVIAANCQIILPIFGFLFMLVGCVLTGKSNVNNTRQRMHQPSYAEMFKYKSKIQI